VVERYLDCGNQKCKRGETRSETSEIPDLSESQRRISDVSEDSDVNGRAALEDFIKVFTFLPSRLPKKGPEASFTEGVHFR